MSAVGSIQDVLQDKGRKHIRNREKQKKNPELKRDSWISSSWETPAPGAYEIRDFLQERQLNPVQPTFSFKCQGRITKPNSAASGELLLPGCYNFPDFAYFADKLPNTYSFKNTRRNTLLLGIRDKDLHTEPNRYNVVPLPSEPRECKDFMFRSAVKRFPSSFLVPREGPGPGDYEVKRNPSCGISSCFRSKVPRFPAYRSKTPGPGTYEPIRQFPKQTPTVAKMGRLHNIFFSSSFDLEIVNRRKQ
ncbi:protein STPG4 [Xenopus laevis]|uniref:Protein STPG4 n=1 Tax=Xenopus laevis TaxID=8355 RepID=A0A8J0VET4_XENLA|nr:protein STPG4 [Xenopus laevis]